MTVQESEVSSPLAAPSQADLELQQEQPKNDNIDLNEEDSAGAQVETDDVQKEEDDAAAAARELAAAAELAGEKDEDFAAESECLKRGEFFLNALDASFNAVPGDDGKSLFTMQGEGLTQIFAGMRANYGFKSGRYYFEVKLLDHPRQTRVGFSAVRNNPLQPRTLERESLLGEDSGTVHALSGLCLDDELSFAFDAQGVVYGAGSKTKDANPKWSRTDIIGVLLNVQKKTISLFLNGTKTPTGQVTTIPDSFFDEAGNLKEALYPTVACKASAVECNFSQKIWKDLPYTVRMVSHAKLTDIQASPLKLSEKNLSQRVEVIIPVGFDVNPVIQAYVKSNGDALVLTQDALTSWAEKSGNVKRQVGGGGAHKFGIMAVDQPNSVFPMLLSPLRRYVYSFSIYNNLHPKARKDTLLKLSHAQNVEVTAIVNANSIRECTVESSSEGGGIQKSTIPATIRENFEAVSLPIKEEGFHKIVYSGGTEEEAIDMFQQWKKDCKMKSKIPASELKKTTYFAEAMAEFNRLKQLRHKATGEVLKKKREAEKEARRAVKKAEREAERKKKEAEEGELPVDDPAANLPEGDDEDDEEEGEEFPEVLEEWSEEDWMLALLRTEIYVLLLAFKKDVNDLERPSFPAVHFPYYYQLYTSKALAHTLSQFSAQNFDELARLVPELCKHTQDVDEFSLRTDKNSSPLIGDWDLVTVMPVEEAESDPTAPARWFIQMTEDARQMRTDRLDAGDENAALTFTYHAPQPNANPARNLGGGNCNGSQNGNKQMGGNRGAYDAYNPAKRQRGNTTGYRR